MRHENTVRAPSLANSRINTDSRSNLSIGDTLRKAKTNLFFSRCLAGILVVVVVTAIFVAFYMGYAGPLFDLVNKAVG